MGTGVDVYSAQGGGTRGGYVRLSGTSMSSPAVAGVAALVMEAQPDFAGNAALARAHLMASAVKPDAWLDTEDAFPTDNSDGPGALNARYGLGKVSGTTSVFDRPEDDGWESGGWHGIVLDAGESWEDMIDVPAGAHRLDVVLTWDEPPADVIANTVLNDLDLWLDPPSASSAAEAGSRSRRDNVEWVIVRNPPSGRWRVRVDAKRVHGGKPRAALAYTIIRGPSTPQLSIVAASDTLGANGHVELTVSTDGYVAAGTRLVMGCRTADGDPCHAEATYEEVRADAPAAESRDIAPGSFVALGEIRAGEPRTVRFADLKPDGNTRVRFTVTGWNAIGASATVFAEEADAEFAAPTNDDFAEAAELAGPVMGDLLAATTEPGEPAFQDGTERPAASVWYRWKATAAGPVHFSLAPADSFSFSPRDGWYDEFETRVDIYEHEGASIARAREVASAPWGASFLAEEDGDYLVRVAGRARAAPFKLSWRKGGAPGNDAFDAAIALEGGEGQVRGTNAGATLESGEQFGPLAATVWYEWAAPDDGWYEFGLSAAHLKVFAFRDALAVGELRLVSGFPEDQNRFPAKAGDAYRVAVASRDSESAGTDFVLSWAALAEHESSNDLLENAGEFADAESSSRSVDVRLSETVEPGEPPESGVRTEWWSWTAPARGEYTWRLDEDDLRLAAFKGDALDALVPAGSNDGPTGEFSFAADEGGQIHSWSGTRPAAGSWLSGTTRSVPTRPSEAMSWNWRTQGTSPSPPPPRVSGWTTTGRPCSLGTVALPQLGSWRIPKCFGAARNGRFAADAFCTNGDAFALAWRDGDLAITDLVAYWMPNRYNDVVPDLDRWSSAQPDFAASPDGRHAYTGRRGYGIAVFERIGNETPGTATVTIAADASEVVEGMSADFALTRFDSVGALTVNINVTESGAMIEGTPPTTVLFDDGMATAVLNIPTEDDAVDEPISDIRATVAAGTGYVPGIPGSAIVSVTDDDGRFVFGSERVVTTDADGARSVYAADLDDDGDLDVLSASHVDGKIAWYENLGGGGFAAQRVITTDARQALAVHAVDLDGDGDADVLWASDYGSRIAWHENLGGGAFSAQRLIVDQNGAAQSVHAADLDGDGDADVVLAESFDDKIAWVENLGDGTFSAQRHYDRRGLRDIRACRRSRWRR